MRHGNATMYLLIPVSIRFPLPKRSLKVRALKLKVVSWCDFVFHFWHAFTHVCVGTQQAQRHKGSDKMKGTRQPSLPDDGRRLAWAYRVKGLHGTCDAPFARLYPLSNRVLIPSITSLDDSSPG